MIDFSLLSSKGILRPGIEKASFSGLIKKYLFVTLYYSDLLCKKVFLWNKILNIL